MPNPLNTSYSGHELFHDCARKFEIEKLLLAGDKEDNIDFITGHAIGEGAQLLLQDHNIETSIWAAYKHWLKIGLDFEHKKKSFWRVVKHLEKFQAQTWPNLQAEGWELVYFTSSDSTRVPACELSFRIIFPNGYIYRGYIDAVIYNVRTDTFAILEIKTTSINANVAMYQNSFQGSSYSFVLDKITGRESYEVIYPVFEFPSGEQQVFSFVKQKNTKLRWLTSLALDFQMMDIYKEHKHWPMRGKSCYAFFKPCKWLGLCELSNKALGKVAENGMDYAEQPLDDKEYHFTFTLEELLQEASAAAVNEKELVT